MKDDMLPITLGSTSQIRYWLDVNETSIFNREDNIKKYFLVSFTHEGKTVNEIVRFEKSKEMLFGPVWWMIGGLKAKKEVYVSSKREYMKTHFLEAEDVMKLKQLVKDKWLYSIESTWEISEAEFPESLTINGWLDEKDVLDAILQRDADGISNDLVSLDGEDKLFATGEQTIEASLFLWYTRNMENNVKYFENIFKFLLTISFPATLAAIVFLYFKVGWIKATIYLFVFSIFACIFFYFVTRNAPTEEELLNGTWRDKKNGGKK